MMHAISSTSAVAPLSASSAGRYSAVISSCRGVTLSGACAPSAAIAGFPAPPGPLPPGRPKGKSSRRATRVRASVAARSGDTPA